nr:unnamed protein product [Callosobruchus analis]
MVTLNTRNNHCIDNIFLNINTESCKVRIISEFMSDHLDQLLNYRATVETVLKECRPITEHGKLNLFKLVEDINWNFIHDETLDRNEKFEMFINKIQSCLHKAFPTKMLPTRSNLPLSASWMNHELKEIRNQLYFVKRIL